MQAISPKSAIAMIPDGASLMIGGFLGVGMPELLVDELVRQGKRELTVIANDTAAPGKGIGKLVSAKLPRKGGGEPYRPQSPGVRLAIAITVIEFLWDGWRPHSAVLGRV
jgi:hypothetical protein